MVCTQIGFRWSKIASRLPGRTDNEIKNVWNTHLKKRLAPKKVSESSADESKPESSITSSSSSSSESFFSNERPNSPKTTTPSNNEFNDQAEKLSVEDKMDKDSEKQLSNELVNITEDPKESSVSLSSVESNIVNTSQIVEHKPEEEQLASPLPYLGHYDVGSILEEVDKPNHLIEIPWEPDYDFWKLLDDDNSLGSFQSNEVQLGEFPAIQNIILGEESVHDAEAKKWSQDFENEFGVVGEMKESNKDHFLPKNYAVEPEMDHTQAFDFDDIDMARPESELDFGYIQLWPSCPQNNNTSL